MRFRRIIYRDARNWIRKLLENSNGVTFDLGVLWRPMRYRAARNWTTEALDNFKRHNFWLGCMIEAHDISRHSKLNNKSSCEIQLVKTFHSDVQFRHIIHRDARNWTRKLSAYSDSHNFLLRCMIEPYDVSRRSKLNNRSSREIQMVITCHSDVWLKCIIYRDNRNWTTKVLEKFKWS